MQGLRHPVLLAAHDRALALHRDVGEDVDHLAGRAGAALDLAALDREALPDAGPRARALVLAHQRDVVLEHLAPALDDVGRLELVVDHHLARLGKDGVDLGGRGLQLAALGLVQVGEVVRRVLVGHAGPAILDLGIALGDDRVGLARVAGVQERVEVLDLQAVLGHRVDQGPQLLVDEVLGALGGAAVEQLLL